MKILKDMKRETGCDYISDLKYLDKWIVPAFKKMKWEKYSAEEIKKLMSGYCKMCNSHFCCLMI